MGPGVPGRASRGRPSGAPLARYGEDFFPVSGNESSRSAAEAGLVGSPCRQARRSARGARGSSREPTWGRPSGAPLARVGRRLLPGQATRLRVGGSGRSRRRSRDPRARGIERRADGWSATRHPAAARRVPERVPGPSDVAPPRPRPDRRSLRALVLGAVALAVAVGSLAPSSAVAAEPTPTKPSAVAVAATTDTSFTVTSAPSLNAKQYACSRRPRSPRWRWQPLLLRARLRWPLRRRVT